MLTGTWQYGKEFQDVGLSAQQLRHLHATHNKFNWQSCHGLSVTASASRPQRPPSVTASASRPQGAVTLPEASTPCSRCEMPIEVAS